MLTMTLSLSFLLVFAFYSCPFFTSTEGRVVHGLTKHKHLHIVSQISLPPVPAPAPQATSRSYIAGFPTPEPSPTRVFNVYPLVLWVMAPQMIHKHSRWLGTVLASARQNCHKVFMSSNLTVQGLIVKNSPQFHFRFDNCQNVLVEMLSIKAPALSPNTDGIHIENTNNVHIYNSVVSNGDDCVSIGAGCHDVNIRNITCGPSHGISIGSLGIRNSQACVSNVTVTDSMIKHSDNGVRIKTWQGGYGSGTYDVRSPPLHLACSDSVPCSNLIFSDIELLPAKGQFVADPFCWNAFGATQTVTIPPLSCLSEGIPRFGDQTIVDQC
ncbi:hypothetical protein GH714_006373 [Hevea brasiliensis]|uniref:Polygalacturonase n=1 Tax=Hevea brasiliensis TaxID=3981 RepID=A0A6A6NG21_HEVBR|nr:hypothetical protein GH714_006373 [Hevea brasiliensis]